MNERIKELALEAGAEFAKPNIDYFGEQHPGGVLTDKLDVKKFAELIIEEYRTKMIETVQNLKDAPWADNAYPAEPMVVWLSSVVENYFGIE